MTEPLTRERLTVVLYGGEDYHVYDGTRLIAKVGCAADVRWLLDRDSAVMAERDALKEELGKEVVANYSWMSAHKELAARHAALKDAHQDLTRKFAESETLKHRNQVR